MTKKNSWLIALLAIGLLVISACAPVATPAGESGMASEEASSEEMDDSMEMASYEDVDPTSAVVTFWHQHSGGREEVLQEIVAAFNDSNEYGITVEASNQGGYGDIFNKMLNVAGTTDAPNLVVAYQNQAATYQLADALIDMTPLVDSETWGLADEDKADFFEGFYNADIFPSFDGARLGFPPNRSMEVMYYNADWLAELGFDGPPETPDEFAAAACAAAATPFTGVVGEAPSIGYQLSADASRFASWTFAMGGDVFDYDAGAYSYDNEAATQAMSFLQGLFNDGCAAEVAERYGDQTDFGNGSLLFTVGSSSGLPFYKSAVEDGAGFNWSIAPLPRLTDDPVMNLYGASVSIGASTPEQEVATWLFIKYYTSPDVQAQWAQASNYFPVRESVADGMGSYFEENPAYEVAFNLLGFGKAEPPMPGYDFVRDIVEEQMVAIVNGAEVESTLAALTEESNEILTDQMMDME
ncbi:MAG: extracellular solute-binding protein [Chloroflexota bacterium]